MQLELQKFLKNIIKDNYDIVLDEVKLDIPPKKELWDFAFACFVLSKELKKSPNVIAQDLSKIIEKNDLIESISCEGPYLNIKINYNIYTNFLNELYINKDSFLDFDEWKWKTIVIDYIWANVWKPLHIGHMCTPNQWQVFINLFRKFWYKVIWDTHIWDWWIIFGKLILAFKMWWNLEKLKENAVNHLFELYVKISTEAEKDDTIEQKTRDEFRFLSEWNNDSIELWREFTKYSIDSMQVQLDRLNIVPDYNIWESFYEGLGLPKIEDNPDLKFSMKDIVFELIEKNIATKNDDWSVWVVFEDFEKVPSCILQKRDWTHGYLASDLACIKYRMDNWDPKKIVYFVDVRQQLHLRQVFIIAKKAWWLKEDTELFHAYNWFISLKDWAMSTRKGRIIKLNALLDEAVVRSKNIIQEKRDDISLEELEDIATKIWIWAIKYWYLKKSRESDVIFDWDEFVNFEWNSGPYIQYSYVRARRILENYWKQIDLKQVWFLEQSHEVELLKSILSYKDILNKTFEWYHSHILCKYTYDLTKTFNSFYNKIHILNEENQKNKIIRLKLVELFTLVLKDAFSILWIEMPEKM